MGEDKFNKLFYHHSLLFAPVRRGGRAMRYLARSSYLTSNMKKKKKCKGTYTISLALGGKPKGKAGGSGSTHDSTHGVVDDHFSTRSVDSRQPPFETAPASSKMARAASRVSHTSAAAAVDLLYNDVASPYHHGFNEQQHAMMVRMVTSQPALIPEQGHFLDMNKMPSFTTSAAKRSCGERPPQKGRFPPAPGKDGPPPAVLRTQSNLARGRGGRGSAAYTRHERRLLTL